MSRIGVIGDRESIVGFRAVGLEVFPADDSQEARKTVRKRAEDDYAIIYITEELASQIESEIDRYKDERLPAIIVIPSKDGASGSGMRNVKEAVKRAVGADILFGGNE